MPQNCEKQAKSGFQHRHLTLVGRKSGSQKMPDADICIVAVKSSSVLKLAQIATHAAEIAGFLLYLLCRKTVLTEICVLHAERGTAYGGWQGIVSHYLNDTK